MGGGGGGVAAPGGADCAVWVGCGVVGITATENIHDITDDSTENDIHSRKVDNMNFLPISSFISREKENNANVGSIELHLGTTDLFCCLSHKLSFHLGTHHTDQHRAAVTYWPTMSRNQKTPQRQTR